MKEALLKHTRHEYQLQVHEAIFEVFRTSPHSILSLEILFMKPLTPHFGDLSLDL